MKLKQGHVLDVNKVLTQLLAARKKSDKPVHVSLEEPRQGEGITLLMAVIKRVMCFKSAGMVPNVRD